MLRAIVRAHLDARGATPGVRSFDAITGIVDLDAPADLVGNWDQAMDEAILQRYRKKSGQSRPAAGRKPPRRKRG